MVNTFPTPACAILTALMSLCLQGCVPTGDVTLRAVDAIDGRPLESVQVRRHSYSNHMLRNNH
jgi:hypothetical protein